MLRCSSLFICHSAASHASHHRYDLLLPQAVASLPAMGPWASPAERGPSLDSIYRVSLTVDLCEGNKIISFKKFISPQPVGGPSKRKKIRGPGHVPSVPIG